jgi:hypothetical protein
MLDEISRTTFDGLRVSIDNGILYLGLYAVNRKPLTGAEVALVAGVVALCDSTELKDVVTLARKLDTPGAIWKALEDKKNPPPKPKRRPRRGEFRSARIKNGVIVIERW